MINKNLTPYTPKTYTKLIGIALQSYARPYAGINFSNFSRCDLPYIIRQQARHLGINAADWTEEDVNSYRDRRWDGHEKPIKVEVHVLSVVNKLDLVYFVTVNEHPVPAATAVRDMGLVTVQEAADYLGYTVRIKARRKRKS